jgi:hypothetical protein
LKQFQINPLDKEEDIDALRLGNKGRRIQR